MPIPPAEAADSAEAASSFTEYLVAALSHFADARWLGTHSPFATPYFLGSVLAASGAADSPQRRGQVLQRVLLQAALALDEPLEHADDIPLETLKDLLRHGTREQQLLYWKYVHHPKAPVEFIIDQMIVAKATYHRNVKEKLPALLQQLGQTVLRLIRPSLRLEPPPLAGLVGRDGLLGAIRATLEESPVLMLDGMPGVGKTALAAGVAARWPGPVFWYTVRPALNDSASSFLLILGLFLHTHGTSHLWSQMIVDGAAIQPQIAAQLAVADLKALAQIPLLCIDGIDVLHSGDQPRHAVLQALLAALAEAAAGTARMIAIGQPLPVQHAAHLTVPTFDRDAAAEFLRQSGVRLPSSDEARAFEYARGNIQALKMLAILYHAGETLDSMLERLPRLPSMVAFATRLRHHLAPDEQRLIGRLAVFRQPVPLYLWGDESAAVEQLRRRQIVHVHAEGSVSVWPALREAFYALLSDGERQLNHRIAATIRTQSGQYTAAAYHYVRSGHPELAV
ncbi:MAG TPA: hypothetical protein VD886_15125, partial [Herpetosiphonaceae bacterium]|nr:hypothetical protein [Herpetosiphonaceae bacterium]